MSQKTRVNCPWCGRVVTLFGNGNLSKHTMVQGGGISRWGGGYQPHCDVSGMNFEEAVEFNKQEYQDE